MPIRSTRTNLRFLKRYLIRHTSTSSRSRLLSELSERGLIAAITHPELNQHLSKPSCIYSGVDPSASSLHVGNLLPLIGMLHFQQAGHKTLAVIGGATGSIGDPSGRSTERPILSSADLQANVDGITAQVHRFFLHGLRYIDSRWKGKEKERGVEGGRVEVLNNLDWTKGISFLDFLRTVGKMAKVNVMLSRDSVKNRLETESGISFTEFSYQLLQAYDFAHLHREHQCRIQLGGSDQWGNIVAGIDLIKREHSANMTQSIGKGEEAKGKEKGTEVGQEVEAYGITIPLLTTSTGEKFGKSAGNAVWLDERRTPVSEFYQFFYRVHDDDVERYLKLFTFLPFDQIRGHMKRHEEDRARNWAQYVLAGEVTELVHGSQALHRARTAQKILYRHSLTDLKSSDVLEAFQGDSRLRKVSWKDIKGVPVSKLGIVYGLFKSRGEATRAISRKKALWVSGRLIEDPRDEIRRQDCVDGHVVIVRWGTKQVLLLYVEFDGEGDGLGKDNPGDHLD